MMEVVVEMNEWEGGQVTLLALTAMRWREREGGIERFMLAMSR